MAVCNTVLPPTNSDLCDVGSHLGEISQLYFTRYGDSLTDWESNAEWVTRLDNTDVLPAIGTDAPIRTLFGIGGIAAPERTSIVVSRRRTVNTTPKYTLTFQVEDTGEENMAAANALPVAGQQFAIWFGTEELLFGGDDGILGTIIMDPIIPESIDAIMTIQVTLTWSGAFPDMIANHLS